MKNIIVLGGGNDQVPLIKQISKIGLKSIVVDYDLNCPGGKLCDIFIHKSNRDYDAIVEELRNIGLETEILTVVVMGTDLPHVAVKIAKELNIDYWMDEAAAEIATNKVAMKSFLLEQNIPSACQIIIDNVGELREFLNVNKKAVIKPQAAAGSRGVFLIDSSNLDRRQISDIYMASKTFSEDLPLIVEQYIEGAQLSVEALMIDGMPQIYGFALRNYEMNSYFSPQIIENGGIQPYPPLFYKIDEVRDIILKIMNSLSIQKGVIKLDLVVDTLSDQIFVIEFALRLSGGNFSSDIIPKSLGVSIIRDYINLFKGQAIKKVELNNFKKIYANRYFFREGKIDEEFILDCPLVEKSEQLLEIGHYVDKIKTHGDRAGWFLTSANTVSQLQKNIESIYNQKERYIKNVDRGDFVKSQ